MMFGWQLTAALMRSGRLWSVYTVYKDPVLVVVVAVNGRGGCVCVYEGVLCVQVWQFLVIQYRNRAKRNLWCLFSWPDAVLARADVELHAFGSYDCTQSIVIARRRVDWLNGDTTPQSKSKGPRKLVIQCDNVIQSKGQSKCVSLIAKTIGAQISL